MNLLYGDLQRQKYNWFLDGDKNTGVK